MREVADSARGTRAGPAGGSGASALAVAARPAQDPAADAAARRIAQRHRLKAAVFGRDRSARRDQAPLPGIGGHAGLPGGAVPGTVIGEVLDVSPHVLVVGQDGREERLALPPGGHAWRGARTDPARLRTGDRTVVRRNQHRGDVADRIWANIGRVTGIIARRDRGMITVDTGDGRLVPLAIPAAAAGRIQVRFPRLEPGYLIDVIGLDRGDHVEGLVPATSQPPYRADHAPGPPLVNGHVPAAISGSASWNVPDWSAGRLPGVGYPAVDPGTGTAPPGARPAPGCVRLPYLSVGSLLRVRNDCTSASAVLPVTGDAPTARLFCDRSVACGPSPRGRIAELTVASFVALGGELDAGSFNVTLEIGD